MIPGILCRSCLQSLFVLLCKPHNVSLSRTLQVQRSIGNRLQYRRHGNSERERNLISYVTRPNRHSIVQCPLVLFDELLPLEEVLPYKWHSASEYSKSDRASEPVPSLYFCVWSEAL